MIEKSAKAYCPLCGSNKIYILFNSTVGYKAGEVIVKMEDGSCLERQLEFDYDKEDSVVIESVESDITGFICHKCGADFSVPDIQTKPVTINPLESFIYDWEGHRFDSGSWKTDYFIRFSRELKTALNKCMPDHIEIAKYSEGHFYINIFFRNKNTGNYANYFTSDVRYFQDEWVKYGTIRAADDTKDHRGATNIAVKLVDIFEEVDRLTGGKNG